MKNNIIDKIDEILEKKSSIEQNFFGYIPEQRINYWILAIRESLPEIQALALQLKTSLNGPNWRISMEIRLILIFFRATFRLTTTQLEIVLKNNDNSLLFQFLKLFSEHIYISHSEWSNRNDKLTISDPKIELLAWKIKDRYHELFLEGYIKDYLGICEKSHRCEDINIVEMLEGINYTKYFPQELLTWKNGYPIDMMCKIFVFMKLRMIPSIPYLDLMINEKFLIKNNLVPVIGNALGFYTRIPALDKLYRAYRTFNVDNLEKILDSNVELLIKEGIINLDTLIGDSTTCRTRRDDPNGVKYHKKDKDSARVMKFQVLADSNCIPLALVPRTGNENDRRGFESLKQKLIKIKNSAETFGLKINIILLDAGYFSLEIIEFIEKEIGAIPVIDINPMNSKVLKLIKEKLEYFKCYFREIMKLGLKFPKLANMCYTRFLEDVANAQADLEKIKGIRPGLVGNYLRIFREVGFNNFITWYRQRPIIEGLFGMMKSCYSLLGRTDRRLPIEGRDQAQIHGLFILIAMQYLAYFNYKVLNKKNHLLRSLYYIKFKEINVIY